MIRITIALATIVGLANVAAGQVVRERIFGVPYTQFGSTVAAIGDVDLDGIADYAVGEPNYNASSASHEGRVSLYSGASGTLIRVHVGSAGDSLGASVRGAGDVDGDGADDVLVGAPQHSSSNYFEEGLAVVYSGQTGSVIWSVHGSDDFQQVGVCVDSAGDLDDAAVYDQAKRRYEPPTEIAPEQRVDVAGDANGDDVLVALLDRLIAQLDGAGRLPGTFPLA